MNSKLFCINRRKKGFTLGELLAVVAIIIILFAIGVPAVFAVQKSLRQKELDTKAETIYMSVQNQLTKMKANGNTACLDYKKAVNKVTQMTAVPYDCVDDKIENGDLSYVTSAALSDSTSAVAKVMTAATLDEGLLNNHWVIEFNPSSCIVYAVFYSEDRADCADEYQPKYSHYDEDLRSGVSARKDDGARVGYYGGGSADSANQSNTLTPTISVVNAETLTATITCTLPLKVKVPPVFKVEFKDVNGSTYTCYYASWDCDANYKSKISAEAGGNDVDYYTMSNTGRIYKVNLTLDDLTKTSTRFNSLYGSSSTHTEKLQPGPLTITVTAMCPGNSQTTKSQSDSVVTNSLFADDNSDAGDAYGTKDSPAAIACGRHLQNLDASSGVDTLVKYAVQKSDVVFEKSETSSGVNSWYDTYAKESNISNSYFNGEYNKVPNFKPISNASLVSYDGGDTAHSIIGLQETVGEGDAGLFLSLNDTKVKNLVLTGTAIADEDKDASVGAIAGKANGTSSIENVQVYLTKKDIADKTNLDVWISGNVAGGLVGTVSSNASLALNKSSASTVIGSYDFNASDKKIDSYEASSVGGLVGLAENASRVTIESSYADNYLAGKIAGGLVGNSAGTANVTDSYVAGYASFTEGAGLVYGQADMKSTYTILQKIYNQDGITYYSTAKSGSASGAVWYSEGYAGTGISVDGTSAIPDESIDALTADLGSGFTANTDGSRAYNLMGQTLTAYTFPMVKDVIHYGDWAASFQKGAIVYYEVYSDGTYGFYGAGLDSTLQDNKTIIGDGYGLIFRNDQTLPESVDLTITGIYSTSQKVSISSATHAQVTGKDTRIYNIYPLDISTVNNTSYTSSDFYLKAEVKTNNYSSYYYFNPHFAKTVIYSSSADASAPVIDEDTEISVRTARQLYMLSLHYDEYADVTKDATFKQEKTIDYDTYGWGTYGGGTKITVQKPIAGGDTAFKAIYDGGCYRIKNISFSTDSGYTVGLFGSNEGTIKNVVLSTQYDKNSTSYLYASRTGNVSGGKELCIGVLCGRNSGEISNCAEAGYIYAKNATIYSYENTTCYAGGLVGVNEGTIRACSAAISDMRLSATFANVSLGGFAGYNRGIIANCYAGGLIEVVYARGGNVSAAGFAGGNGGSISNSYSTTAIKVAGDSAHSYGFAPKGGQFSGCTYLNDGTFSYEEAIYPYTFTGGAGTSKAYAELKKSGKSAKAVSSTDCNYNVTEADPDPSYPFREVVRNADGNLVHYGDWPDNKELGTIGIFYWEHEENGQNNGYHFTYLGLVKDDDTQTQIAGTTLCTAHDDGGVITEYGYGYFEMTEGDTTLSITNATAKASLKENSTAAEALQSQLHYTNADGEQSEYYFHAYTTSTDNLCMTGTVLNSTWNLSSANLGVTCTYTVNPFFANAMSGSNALSIQDTAGQVTDYSKTPGSSTDHKYEVRSYDQLQFINWNTYQKCYDWDYRDNNDPTYGSNCINFSFSDSAGYSYKGNMPYIYNSGLSWKQTHNLEAEDADKDFSERTRFAPLGQAGNGFTNSYDGQSYVIKNLYLSSKSQFVGLFGSVGNNASLTNIILYAEDGKGLVECTYPGTSNGYEPAVGALIGQTWSQNATINNCTAAGYSIQYNVKYGYTCKRYITVGGLIGELYNGADISNCSAANDVKVLKDNSSIRSQIGGLIGSAHSATITNCYTGGSLYVEYEQYSLYGGIIGHAQGNNNNTSSTPYPTNISTNGSACTISNCYTYMDVPQSKGTSRTGCYYISGYNGSISNCYYLNIYNKTSGNSGTTGYAYTQMSDGTLLGKLGGTTGTGSLTSTTGEYHNVTITEGSSNASVDGKYSFPESSSLEGKNYPFPAIITQQDLVFGGYVYVHYGDWPIDSPYWEKGRDSMEIFDSMKDDGYAEKIFYLYPNGDQLTSKPSADAFTFDTIGVAEIASVGDLITDGDHAGAYPVTVRALDSGTTKITLEGTGFTATFNLEITANLTASSDKDTFTLQPKKSETVTFTAVSPAGKSYETDANGSWKLTAEAENVITAAESSPKNVWTVTRVGLGEVMETAVFTYDYHGNKFTASCAMVIGQDGMVGLSNGTVYNVAMLGETAKGTNYTYGVNQPAVSGADAFLYLDSDTAELGKMTIQSVTIGGETPSAENNSDTGYHVIWNSGITADSNYQYLPAEIYKVTSGSDLTAEKDVTLTVVVSDDSGCSYTLTVTLPSVVVRKVITVTYEDGQGHSVSVEKLTGSDALPTEGNYPSGLTIPENKMLNGWKSSIDKLTYKVGSEFDFTEDITFTAAWKDGVKLTLNANAGIFSTGATALVIAADASGNATITNEPSRDHYKFVNWNTSANGSGTTYATGDSINLGGKDTILYAQWERTEYVVTFKNDDTACATLTVSAAYANAGSSLSSLIGYPTTLAKDLYRVSGWYDSSNQLFIDANGKVQKNITDDITVYVKWERSGYVITLMADSVKGTYTDYGKYIITTEQAKSGCKLTDLGSYTNPESNDATLGFSGWYDAKSGGNLIISMSGQITADKITDDITLYSQWSQGYQVTLIDDSGSHVYTVSTADAASGGSLSGYSAPSRTGWTFAGWYASKSSTSATIATNGSFAAGAITGNITLYAKWTRTVYKQVSSITSDKSYVLASGTSGTVSMLYGNGNNLGTNNTSLVTETTDSGTVITNTFNDSYLWTISGSDSSCTIKNNAKGYYIGCTGSEWRGYSLSYSSSSSKWVYSNNNIYFTYTSWQGWSQTTKYSYLSPSSTSLQSSSKTIYLLEQQIQTEYSGSPS